MEENLKKLGLHKNEILVYLALFEAGKSRAGAIIDVTGLHRNLVYTSLKSLSIKGLVAKTERGGVAYFEANSPEALLDFVNDKKIAAEEAVAILKKKQQEVPRDLKIYEGLDGFRQAREHSLALSPEQTVFVLGGSGLSSAPEYVNMWKPYHKKRIQKKINLKILFDRTVPQSYLESRNGMERTAAKYLPFNVGMPARFEMFGDTLTIGVPGAEPLVFSLRSPEAVESLKKFFDYLWQQDTYIIRGPKALQAIWLEGIDTGGISFVGARGYFMDRYPELFKPIEEKMKKTKGVYWKNIVDPGMKGHRLTNYPWSQNRFVLKEISLTVAWLYNNKVAIVNWAEDEPIIFVSENKYLVQSYQHYFNEMWDKK